jgi:hypothetical protein
MRSVRLPGWVEEQGPAGAEVEQCEIVTWWCL